MLAQTCRVVRTYLRNESDKVVGIVQFIPCSRGKRKHHSKPHDTLIVDSLSGARQLKSEVTLSGLSCVTGRR